MAFLYILQSEATGHFYIGSTLDLERLAFESIRAYHFKSLLHFLRERSAV